VNIGSPHKTPKDSNDMAFSSRLKATTIFLLKIMDDLFNAFLRNLKIRLSKDIDIRGKISIGFDGYPFVEPLTGIGRYAEHLLKNFANRENVVINLYTHTLIPADRAPGLFVSLKNLNNVRFRCHPIPRNILMGVKSWLYVGAGVLTPLFIALDHNDVFFAPNFVTPKLFRIINKKVVTIHDCTFAFHPELLQKETLQNLSKRLPEELRTAAKIIAVSTQTKKDVENIFSVPPEKIEVILHGNPIENTVRCEIPNKPYILFVGTLEPRKNILSILDAFEIVRNQGIPLNLKLIGKVGWKSDLIVEKLRWHPFSHAISQLSYVPSEQLGSYYKEAFCLCFPSLYEGFGFPVLEAMSMGCPVVATPLESLKEVGGDACLYVGPSPVEIADGIAELYGDPRLRETLIRRGKARAQCFSWKKCADQTLRLLTEVAQDR